MAVPKLATLLLFDTLQNASGIQFYALKSLDTFQN